MLLLRRPALEVHHLYQLSYHDIRSRRHSPVKQLHNRKSFMLSMLEEKEDFWWSFNLLEILPNSLSLLEVWMKLKRFMVEGKGYSVSRRDFVSAEFVE
ncbi:hypothetical protein S83_001121 [Arachis hypogaea]